MRLHFKLRTLLAAVAVAGVALGAAVGGQRLRERSRQYREWAAIHELSRKVAAAIATVSVSTAEQKVTAKKTAAWRAARRDEYLAAARFPWRDVPVASRPPWEPPLVVPPAPSPATPAVAARARAADRGAPKYTPIPEANRAAYADQMALMKDRNPALYAERAAMYGPPGPPSAATAALVERLRRQRARRLLRLGPAPRGPQQTEEESDTPRRAPGPSRADRDT